MLTHKLRSVTPPSTVVFDAIEDMKSNRFLRSPLKSQALEGKGLCVRWEGETRLGRWKIYLVLWMEEVFDQQEHL